MKYNARYRKLSTVNTTRPQMYESTRGAAADPTPMTQEGTRSLVERFRAFNGGGIRRNGPEVGRGGVPGPLGTTTPIPSGPTKSKSIPATAKKTKSVFLGLDIVGCGGGVAGAGCGALTWKECRCGEVTLGSVGGVSGSGADAVSGDAAVSGAVA